MSKEPHKPTPPRVVDATVEAADVSTAEENAIGRFQSAHEAIEQVGAAMQDVETVDTTAEAVDVSTPKESTMQSFQSAREAMEQAERAMQDADAAVAGCNAQSSAEASEVPGKGDRWIADTALYDIQKDS